MRTGTISQTTMRRSVLKQIKTKTRGTFRTADGGRVIVSGAVKSGGEEKLGMFAVAEAVNHVASKGAKPVSVSVMILLSPEAHEELLAGMAACIEKTCEDFSVELAEIGVKVLPAVSRNIVMAEAYGLLPESGIEISEKVKREWDVVLSKEAGTEGMLRILYEREEELSRRFVPAFIRQMKSCEREMNALKEIAIAKEHGAAFLYQAAEGGILAALWNLSEAADMGLSVEMRKLSVKQETIETCEYFHLNPYQLASAGTMLMLTNDGGGLVKKLQAEGIRAAVIGRTTRKKERVIWNHEEKRYIDRPATDELYKMI